MATRTHRLLRGPRTELLLVGIAYATAVLSVLAYVLVSGGHGRPTRLQFGLLVVPVLVLYLLSIRAVGT